MSIILNCAACNKALPYNAKRCAACKVRYCSKECQAEDWQNGHKKMCKKIARHGGVEKFEAEVHGARFSTAAVELCGGDLPADAICSICEQRGDEPILRACECSGASGLAHLSCLVRRAQIARSDKDKTDTDEAYFAADDKWSKCPTCEKSYHKAVRGALGYACWKTYSSCAPTGYCFGDREFAWKQLGDGLEHAGFYDEAARVHVARLMETEYLFPLEKREIADMWDDIARVNMYRGEEELELSARRESYSRVLALDPEVDIVNDKTVVFRGSSLAISLLYGDQSGEAQVAEARALFRKLAPMSRRAFGPDHDQTLNLRKMYAESLYLTDAASRDDVAKATTILEDVARTARRRASYEYAPLIQAALEEAREKLASLQTKRRRSTRTQAALEAAVLAM